MTATDAERLARVALSRLGEPADPRITTLVAEMGAQPLHEALASERDLEGVLTDVAARLEANDPEGDLARAARLGIRFVVPGDDEWPAQVDDLAHAGTVHERGGVPLGLWVRGPARLDQLADSIAIVGSRSSTTYGEGAARVIAGDVARHGMTVVSGAAFGIDQAAHRGAVAGGGTTVAVLAGGVDRPYPVAHTRLLEHIAETGAVVSEVPPGGAPTRMRFLTRNRVIAALARGTLVVEAAHRSGALSTARWAERLSRPLMAVPGPVTNVQSTGTHGLIRAGAAQLVGSGPEVLELLGASGSHLIVESRSETRARDTLRPREARVLEAVPVSRAAPTESIARTAGLGLVGVQSALTLLLRDGFVERVPAGWRLSPQGRA
ncbi:putative DNA processing protein DprA [Nocardioides phosphati]|uniref:DNA processing protein DprA n=1 Tax=Nocardioides phosphati TaxID=1867775 RepID=A0ABQ2NAD9_9ACTN|nr:DNA-processing protein DprA [Nocardioides phosphati]GGO87547.1 putative DNA processing protein DprA [Nocardioides phosphati]